jgi:hypothetical protein
MTRKQRIRIITTLFLLLFVLAVPASQNIEIPANTPAAPNSETNVILQKLQQLAVKGRAPKTGYTRSQFGDGWREKSGCDTRDIILARDLEDVMVSDECEVESGTLDDPYTGNKIQFRRGIGTSSAVQIDHVVALSNAWQTGAQQLSLTKRENFANDPLNLLAVDGPANQQKSDGDAATWLPSNKPFRCQYVSRQVDIKSKYRLWLTPPEKIAIKQILSRC